MSGNRNSDFSTEGYGVGTSNPLYAIVVEVAMALLEVGGVVADSDSGEEIYSPPAHSRLATVFRRKQD